MCIYVKDGKFDKESWQSDMLIFLKNQYIIGFKINAKAEGSTFKYNIKDTAKDGIEYHEPIKQLFLKLLAGFKEYKISKALELGLSEGEAVVIIEENLISDSVLFATDFNAAIRKVDNRAKFYEMADGDMNLVGKLEHIIIEEKKTKIA